mmetsp:Transcript_15432/g.17130  ORF Transcript_15432/g.17130 Transcript_15432/m.17130 type:complete len:119 (+) Transcript_15432:2038-2394(+)
MRNFKCFPRFRCQSIMKKHPNELMGTLTTLSTGSRTKTNESSPRLRCFSSTETLFSRMSKKEVFSRFLFGILFGEIEVSLLFECLDSFAPFWRVSKQANIQGPEKSFLKGSSGRICLE